MSLPPTPPSQRIANSLRSALVAGVRPPRPRTWFASEESPLPPYSRQFLKLGCLLLLAVLLVACGSPPATHTPPPTATTVPTPTPTFMVPTFMVPTAAPAANPYWTLAPTQLVLTSPDCSMVGANAECILTITHDSNGAEGAASWTATPSNTYGIYLDTSPTQGTMMLPKQSVQVRIEVVNVDFFCRLPSGDNIRFSFSGPVPESDHFVGVSCG